MRCFLFCLSFALSWSTPAFAQSPPPLPELNYGALFVRLSLVLIGVCLFAWLSLRWGLKRYQPQASGPVRVRARVPVEPRRSILLIEVGEKVFVVASTEHGMNNLGMLAAAELPTSEVIEPARFSDVLEKFRPNALHPVEDEP